MTHYNLAYKNPDVPKHDRIEDLLARMTLEEKCGQLHQVDGRSEDGSLVRAGRVGSVLCVLGEEAGKLQREALTTRLGIPLLVAIDAIHGHSFQIGATIFPTQLAVACSWRPELAESMARICAIEMQGTGCSWTFSPVACLARDLRWGRVNETFGEDPVMIGQFAAAAVRGYQTDNLARPDAVAACVKHFAGYGETIGGLDASDAEHSQRKMRALFLPPFKEALAAGAATLMVGYQAIDGVSCLANSWLLTEVLRTEWSYPGMVVSDWNNVNHMVSLHHTSKDVPEAARKALLAGMDMSMTTADFDTAIVAEVTAGRIPLSVVDAAVRRVLDLKFQLGLFEDPRLPNEEITRSVLGLPAHRAAAYEAALASAVLLVNRRETLPLEATRLRRIAVVGPHANDAFEQLGDWSLGASNQYQGYRTRQPRGNTVTVYDGLRQRLGASVEVVHAHGCGTDPSDPTVRTGIPHAVSTVVGSDVCVLVVGDCDRIAGEFKSTATLELPGAQRELVAAIRSTGVPLIIIFMASKPLAIQELAESADALICAFSPGMEGGAALADIILGIKEPTGRLPITFPRHVGQLPVHYQRVNSQHGGYADFSHGTDPLFAFGEGFGYTTWRIVAARVVKKVVTAPESVECEVTLMNTGNRCGSTVLQVYVRDMVSSATWPERVLKTWVHVTCAAGSQQNLRISLKYDQLACVDAQGLHVVEAGDFELQFGFNSRDKDLWKLPFSVI